MAHTYTKLSYHCIFSTKDRRPMIDAAIQDRLYGYIGGILHHHEGRLLRVGGVENHVHLLIELLPSVSVSDTMRVVKANSSKWLHETFPEQKSFAWQTGFSAFTVSASGIDDVIRYIANQEEHHRRRTFEEEYVEFLRRHGIEYDPRYLWD